MPRDYGFGVTLTDGTKIGGIRGFFLAILVSPFLLLALLTGNAKLKRK